MLITFVNSLDPDQDRPDGWTDQTVGHNLVKYIHPVNLKLKLP